MARSNGVGIDRDVRILTDSLAAWRASPRFSHHREISWLRRYYDRRDTELAIVFLERVPTRWLRRAGRYLLIPNQERYPERLIPRLRRVDHVLTKSCHAHEIFSAHHPSVSYIGFTSVDRDRIGITPDYTRFLHLAGGSALKGTAALLDVWARHPEWPTLTVVHHRRDASYDVPANVNLIRRYLPDPELIELQNRCGIHLCPSLSEGWGHYIVEAMSCSAVVVATDAPPMNEIVTPERGVAVPYHRSAPRKLGINYYVDPDSLEAAIQSLIEGSVVAKAALGRAARTWFEDNDRAFHATLRRVMTQLVP